MARALYSCSRCVREWEAMSPAGARTGTGNLVRCTCGEVPTLLRMIEAEIGSIGVKSAANIVAHRQEWAEDSYHANIMSGALALEGDPEWIYRTQWSSGTTYWHHTNGVGEARVCWDDQEGWVVKLS